MSDLACRRYTLASVDLTADYWHRQEFDRVDDDVVAVARRLCGLYGMAPTSYLTSLARVRAFARDALDKALYEDRSLVQIRAMRGSRYMISTELLGIVKSATRRRMVGGFESMIARAIPVEEQLVLAGRVEALLADEHLVAAELRERIDPESPTVAEHFKYLVARMATDGTIVRAEVTGSWRSNRFRYALWEDWVGAPLELWEEDAAQVELATSEPPSGAKAVGVRLAPVWETALIGHVDRTRIVTDERRSQVYDSSGNATSTVLVDGQVAGLWQLDGVDAVTVKVAAFEPFVADVWTGVEAGARLIADAVGATLVGITRCRLPEPLVDAPRNTFLSPLRWARCGD